MPNQIKKFARFPLPIDVSLNTKSLQELFLLVAVSVFQVDLKGAPLEGGTGHFHAEREARVARPEQKIDRVTFCITLYCMYSCDHA